MTESKQDAGSVNLGVRGKPCDIEYMAADLVGVLHIVKPCVRTW